MSDQTSTRLVRDVSAHVPAFDAVTGLVALSPEHDAIWRLAAPRLRTRNNDVHTVYAYGMARALLPLVPDADPDVVLPAILLHDTGWSTVPDAEVLEAIAPGGGRPDLVRHHEIQGAVIARDVLSSLGYSPAIVDAVTEIIDGHDSRLHALHPSDAVVKDADKLWRITPNGVNVVMGWFSLTREEAVRLCAARVHDAVFTEPARAMARALSAVASIDIAPQRDGLF